MNDRKHTLREYINQNEKLLTVLGVFIALTVFFSGLEIKIFAAILSLTSLTCAVLIWLELWATFPSESGTGTLTWFENVLSIGTLALIVFWVYEIYNLYPGAIVFLLTFTIMWPMSVLLKKWDVFNRCFNSKEGDKKYLRYLVGWSIILIIYVASFYAASFVSPYVERAFDSIKQQNLDPATMDWGDR